MNIIALHGSPHKDGNSDTLVKEFLKGINEKGTHNITHFYANELDISPCQGCLTCATSKDHACIIEDDMQQIYTAYKNSDLIIFSTPMYWGYMTAQLKSVFDRMEALAWEGFSNKIFVVIITYRHHFESTAAFFERITPFFNINLYIITCCTFNKETLKDLPIMSCKKELNQAYSLGKLLGS